MIEIPLTKGYVTVIDDEDFELVARHRWSVHDSKQNCGHRYAVCRRRPQIYMHRLILGLTERRIEVDHKDGDGLNNRRENLRKALRGQNAHNMAKTRGGSRFKGVYFDKERALWHAQISLAAIDLSATKRYRRYNLGRFVDEEVAARAYDAKATELFGEFARLNFERKRP